MNQLINLQRGADLSDLMSRSKYFDQLYIDIYLEKFNIAHAKLVQIGIGQRFRRVPGGELLRRERLAYEITLCGIAAEACKVVPHRTVFHPFGHHPEPEVVSEINGGTYNQTS